MDTPTSGVKCTYILAYNSKTKNGRNFYLALFDSVDVTLFVVKNSVGILLSFVGLGPKGPRANCPSCPPPPSWRALLPSTAHNSYSLLCVCVCACTHTDTHRVRIYIFFTLSLLSFEMFTFSTNLKV